MRLGQGRDKESFTSLWERGQWRGSGGELPPGHSSDRPSQEHKALLATAGNTAATLETGHTWRRPHPEHQRAQRLSLEASAKTPVWASRGISGHGSQLL